ncbi:DUF998 domain-containing protein [Phycicoccus sp. CSK15P-2]|uniref:DUF998 domain-containing protein n=1 Tax=Phycicoccus sp. CSK15P-2 TaxID=2807627 RepID=UPI0019518D0E|nr:DUF998 domain-containing protein [Phycicoccus sp. CSK15P-2]MBM6405379.1 DUF998 domain-containing protein [Phycicoccus sp. CSK15P-2]
MARPAGALRTAVVSATTAVVALVGGWTWAQNLIGGFDARSESISALASLATPHRWVMTTGLVVTGLAHCVTAYALGSAHRVGRAVLAAGGVATVGVALVPLPGRGETSAPHVVLATLAFALLAVWPAFAARPGAATPVLTPRVARTAAVVLALAVASLATGVSGGAFGLHERVVAALTVLWPFVTAVGVWWSAGHRIGSRRLRHVLAGLLLTGACTVAGLAATTVAPVTAHTRTYQATVALDADPRLAGDLVAETTFGDVEVSFAGVAPGIRAVPQVKSSITDVLSRPGASLASLQPDPTELNAAIRDVGTRVMGRFAFGALVLLLVVLGAWSLARHRLPPRWLVGAGVTAWLASSLGTTASIYTTYQPSRLGSFGATEVLGTLQQNQGLLGDVETRATQVAPYLRNLLALSTALQQKYAAGALEADPALRVLFVSDIHGGNQYPLMRTIVEQQSIDLVVDGGDLLNFGTVPEGDAADIFSGIESVGVPYVFVKGNHDAAGEDDTAVLDRLAQVPNVVLLESPEGEYREVAMGGVTIAGFNDPRWFGDSGTGTREAQQPARADFEEAFADREAPDVVVSHEPWGLENVSAGVRLNGHMHASDLEGNRIQVGTFTGGGPLTHFLADEDGEELRGQPSAFDILTFGTDCRLSSLTRYTLHDVIEGRPSYDDVSIINGGRIDTRQPDPDRACEPGTELTTTVVP